MKKRIDYKVPNGKLMRIDIDIDDEVIIDIKITGDFFLHPEEAIVEIEKLCRNTKVDQVEEKLNNYVKKNNIELLGIRICDLAKAIMNCK